MLRNVHIELALAWPPFIFLLAVLIFIAYAVWMYRKTLPPVSPAWKTFLIVLRSSAFFCILLLLFQPILRLSFRSKKKPAVAVLVDVSASMQIVDQGKSRGKIVEGLFQSEPFREFKNRHAVHFFLFSDSVHGFQNLPKAFVFDGAATNISGALERLAGERPDAALLFSDGIYNAGKNPVHAVEPGGFPVYAVAVGDPSEKADVLISRLQTNELAYAGSRTPVRISLRGPGFGGKTAELVLQSEGVVLDQASLVIPPDGMEAPVELHYQFEKSGFRALTAVVKPLQGEVSQNNNSQECTVQILKSKMKVLLLADAPSPDLAFLKRALAADPNVDLVVRTPKNSSTFFEGLFPNDRELREMDEFWLLDVPSRFYPDAVWQRVLSILQREGKPFLLIAGKNLDIEKIGSLGARLPVRFGMLVPERSVLPVLTPEGRVHPLLKLENASDMNRLELPPVFSPWERISVEPPSRMLMEAVPEKPDASGIRKQPLFVMRNAGGQKSAAILARGLFRWKLMMLGTKQPSDLFRVWIGHFVRWLGVREEDRPVRISVNRPVVRTGEENAFSVQVYDESARPVEGADVLVRFAVPDDPRPIRLVDQGSGLYQAVFHPFKAGRIQAVAEASFDGRVLGKDTTEFAVSPFNFEFFATRARPELLAMLAEKSGGKSGPPDSLGAVLKSIRIPEKTGIRKTEWELGFRPAVLAWILLLLSAEWFIRRRKGMV